MPHISLTHTQSLTELVKNLLPKLNQALQQAAPDMTGIKIYGISTSQSFIEGRANTDMLHLSFRILRGPERSEEIVRLWLDILARIIKENLPNDCRFTAEASFLPDIYISKTAASLLQ